MAEFRGSSAEVRRSATTVSAAVGQRSAPHKTMGLIVNIAARRLAKADINPERCITMIFYATLQHHLWPSVAHKIQVNTTSSRNISDFIMRARGTSCFPPFFAGTQRNTHTHTDVERESRGGDLRTRSSRTPLAREQRITLPRVKPHPSARRDRGEISRRNTVGSRFEKKKRIVEIRCSMIIALKRRVNISLDNFVSLCKEYSILQKLVGYFSI